MPSIVHQDSFYIFQTYLNYKNSYVAYYLFNHFLYVYTLYKKLGDSNDRKHEC
jgi:hypothetical protein